MIYEGTIARRNNNCCCFPWEKSTNVVVNMIGKKYHRPHAYCTLAAKWPVFDASLSIQSTKISHELYTGSIGVCAFRKASGFFLFSIFTLLCWRNIERHTARALSTIRRRHS